MPSTMRRFLPSSGDGDGDRVDGGRDHPATVEIPAPMGVGGRAEADVGEGTPVPERSTAGDADDGGYDEFLRFVGGGSETERPPSRAAPPSRLDELDAAPTFEVAAGLQQVGAAEAAIAVAGNSWRPMRAKPRHSKTDASSPPEDGRSDFVSVDAPHSGAASEPLPTPGMASYHLMAREAELGRITEEQSLGSSLNRMPLPIDDSEFSDDDDDYDASGHGRPGMHMSSFGTGVGGGEGNVDGFGRPSCESHPTTALSGGGGGDEDKKSGGGVGAFVRRPSTLLYGDSGDGHPRRGGDGGGDPQQQLDGFNVSAAFEKEHKAVRKFKVVVVLVLVVAAITVVVLVYKFTSNAEHENMLTEYNDYANKFITNFHHLNVMRMWSAHTVASMFTAQCINRYGPEVRPWPNITLPDFPDQVRGSIETAHGSTIEFSPLFPNEDAMRRGWEAYAVENEDAAMHIPEWARTSHGGGHGGGHGHGGDPISDKEGEVHLGAHAAANHGMGSQPDHESTATDVYHGANEEEQGEVGAHAAAYHGMDSQPDHTATANADEYHGAHGVDHDAYGGGDSNQEMELTSSAAVAEESFGPGMSDALHAAHTDEAASGGLRRRRMATGNVFEGEEVDRGAGHVMEHGEGEEGMAHDATMEHVDRAQDHVHPRRPIEEGIYTMDGENMVDETPSVAYLAPAWQIFPLMGNEGRLLYNEYSDFHRRGAINTMLATGGPALTEVLVGFADHHHYYKEPSSVMLYPVHDSFDDKNKTLVGSISITFSWMSVFWNILPENIRGVIAVIETSTGQLTSYRVDGKFGSFIGEGDHHDRKFDHLHRLSSIYRVYEKELNVKEMVGHHLRNLEEMEESHNLDAEMTDGEHIDFVIHIYPSDEFEASYLTNQPRTFALAVSLVFFVTVLSFLVYDWLVERRQKKLLQEAERSGKIVDSLFPAMVRDRLFHHSQANPSNPEEKSSSANVFKAGTSMNRLNKKVPHSAQSTQSADYDTGIFGNQIADLYNDTTVMFADIAGFTAWSSEREPTQVFQLLESLFGDFDTEARSMNVFKIETIGDCYLAVTGLPEPIADHAVIMAKFAQRCLLKFSELTKELELSLGPGTADLGIRIGLHSGPVTAGVLRGEKARFQLFGDTMNTASRMESTSIKNMIQVSSDTAALLKKSKKITLIAREGLIKAKGKGYLQTYWVRPDSTASTVSSTSNFSENVEALQAFQSEVDHIHSRAQHDEARAELGLPSFSHHSTSSKPSHRSRVSLQVGPGVSWSDTGLNRVCKQGREEGLRRLIKWNTKVLESILTKLVIQRNEQHRKRKVFKSSKKINAYDESARFHEEIAQAVDMPRFNRDAMSASCLMPSKEKVNLIPPKARAELRYYVAQIACMYRNVHFHSFEHASHVTMSAQKLINKVVLRNSAEIGGISAKKEESACDKELVKKREDADLFFSTYGISADPLAQFAVVFAALVHDVDHTGVPNAQLIKENKYLADKYRSKSVAENNSIQVAWSELLKPEYSNLRRCIFGDDNHDEHRFRQLLINVVIATDIADRERRAGEGVRWNNAFCNVSDWESEWQNRSDDELPGIDISLKATAVLEQIVLASDVAHTMQHWLTYVKWNERLYKEMWAAYVNGRAEKDPTQNWYKGEIGFFDGYIIPLATKLKECGVFGNAGDEYLGNALRNKAEWIDKGEAIVNEFEAKIKVKSSNAEGAPSTMSDKSSGSTGTPSRPTSSIG